MQHPDDAATPELDPSLLDKVRQSAQQHRRQEKWQALATQGGTPETEASGEETANKSGGSSV